MVADSSGKSSKFHRAVRSITAPDTAQNDRRLLPPAGRPARRTAQRGEGNEAMKTTRSWPALGVIGLGLCLAAVSGCQTWVPVPGLTLPSGHYLEHPPQYFPESGPFPLPREMSSMQEGAEPAAGGPEQLPARVQPGGM
jgi:hypothetical protein